ncbi:MAG: ATP-dependent Clp protease adaptor ClpS [Chloroflexota bacterium]|nr:ATP-dependent Clp protease adaptor ClpS [Chloroflexota bacterium]
MTQRDRTAPGAVEVQTSSGTIQAPETTDRAGTLFGWSVLLWNDDVHSMDYVVAVLAQVIGLEVEAAVRVMFEAHTRGKAVAWSGAREIAELYRDGLESYGLTATLAS